MTTEPAWLLEKSDPPEYLCIDSGYFKWTQDASKALRFSRREDGEAMATIVEDANRIIEHQWG